MRASHVLLLCALVCALGTPEAARLPEYSKEVVKRQSGCIPGTTYQKDCNHCTCSAHGEDICTLNACIGKRAVGNPGDPNFRCVPGESFRFECNTCVCTDDGRNAACTLKLCV